MLEIGSLSKSFGAVHSLRDVHPAAGRHRRRTGMVFQQHHLIGRLSAFDNVLLGRIGQHAAWRTLWPLPRADRVDALGALRLRRRACAACPAP